MLVVAALVHLSAIIFVVVPATATASVQMEPRRMREWLTDTPKTKADTSAPEQSNSIISSSIKRLQDGLEFLLVLAGRHATRACVMHTQVAFLGHFWLVYCAVPARRRAGDGGCIFMGVYVRRRRPRKVRS